MKSEPNVVAFEKLFPGSEHFISYYTGQAGTPRWNSKTLIHGRYILSMQFDITVDTAGTKVTAAAAPQFQLREVISAVPSPSGQTSITYNPASHRDFGPEEWKALETSGGDLSTLGIEVIRDQPVPNLAAVDWRGG